MTFRFPRIWAFVLGVAATLLVSRAVAFENDNIETNLNVQSGHVVLHWSNRGFDRYNVRWSAAAGPTVQIERDGSKDFVFLGTYAPGVVYQVAIQGCDTHTLAHSQCGSWNSVSCGDPRHPCDGPPPLPIVNAGSLCLDVDAPAQHTDGGRVQLWACNGSDQQSWTIRGRQVVSLAGKCLDVEATAMRTNGGRVQVWACNGSPQQSWVLRGGVLRNQGGKCLDANLATFKQNGGLVQVWDCNGSAQQRWTQPSTY